MRLTFLASASDVFPRFHLSRSCSVDVASPVARGLLVCLMLAQEIVFGFGVMLLLAWVLAIPFLCSWPRPVSLVIAGASMPPGVNIRFSSICTISSRALVGLCRGRARRTAQSALESLAEPRERGKIRCKAVAQGTASRSARYE